MKPIPDHFGVFYRREDYAGVGRRLLIDVLDSAFAAVVATCISVLILLINIENRELTDLMISLVWICVWFGYFVVVKRSNLRTLGYRMLGVRVVNLKGERPSIIALAVRLLFVFGGPFNFLIDLIWITDNQNRQAMRDHFAGTYVIKRDAEPSGVGRIVWTPHHILGFNFIFKEVRSDVGGQ
jgi:uncharacterized RDD family membrane protein YckC